LTAVVYYGKFTGVHSTRVLRHARGDRHEQPTTRPRPIEDSPGALGEGPGQCPGDHRSAEPSGADRPQHGADVAAEAGGQGGRRPRRGGSDIRLLSPGAGGPCETGGDAGTGRPRVRRIAGRASGVSTGERTGVRQGTGCPLGLTCRLPCCY